jgi:hypothetical protein
VVKKLIRGNVLKEEAPWVNLDVDGEDGVWKEALDLPQRGNGRRWQRRQRWRKVIREAMTREQPEAPYKTKM